MGKFPFGLSHDSSLLRYVMLPHSSCSTSL